MKMGIIFSEYSEILNEIIEIDTKKNLLMNLENGQIDLLNLIKRNIISDNGRNYALERFIS